MSTLAIVPADRERGARAIANMMQLYMHDFSEFWAGEARGELGPDGRFPDYPLQTYWSGDRRRVPLLIERAGAPVGFALLNDHAHSGLPADWSMAEFFIVRKHRRGGTGTAAARLIFSAYPGQWDVAVARRNTAAHAFWGRAIASHPQASAHEELDRDDVLWNGAIFRFRIG